MAIKSKSRKTLVQSLSVARRRYEWLNRLHSNCSPTLNKLANILQLPSNIANVPKSNVLTLEYIGDTSPLGVLTSRARIEKVLGVTLDESNSATVKMRRMTLKIVVAGLPTVAVVQKKAA